MRCVALVVALLAPLAASNAGAHQITLWSMSTRGPNTAPHTFHFGTSETAFIEHAGVFGRYTSYTAADGPNVAALLADLQNGVNNPLTLSTPYLSYTVDENHAHTTVMTPAPVRGVSHYLTSGNVDLAGWRIDSIDIRTTYIASDPTLRGYGIVITGGIPEPSAIALLVLGCCGMHGSRYHRRKVRVS